MSTTSAIPESEAAGKPRSTRRRGRPMGGGASLNAQGEPMIWLTGGALLLLACMIIGLVGLILVEGGSAFWPPAIERVTLQSGVVHLGESFRTESYRLDNESLAALEVESPDMAARAKEELTASDGWIQRRLLRTANREHMGNENFRWISEFAIADIESPLWAVLIERIDGGRFYGFPQAIIIDGNEAAAVPAPSPSADEKSGDGDDAGGSGKTADAAREEILSLFAANHAAVSDRVAQIRRIMKFDIGRNNSRENQARMAVKRAELSAGLDSQEHQQAIADFQRIEAECTTVKDQLAAEVDQLRAENAKFKLLMTSVTKPDEVTEIELGNIVRVVPSNQLGLFGKLGVYVSRWWEFLTEDPREANSEGGVWPAIVGTVTMTLAMALAVVPFGVLASLYLREYAKGGWIISAVRIAINNLAGVPSIVFGLFGLAFFCYIVGGGIDQFFFAAEVAEHKPVFGKPALIWASLTLALLTVPVVIVASEEALSAVPNSMREGSYACGGSKWQTIRRIVLPQALPGIMTGMILAMARGAGEVAPLMLVGALKLSEDLPVDGVYPFVHPDRGFMHLGFHIYDVGLQLQDSNAARPMVFTTTLLLITIIAALNLLAVWIRARLQKRFKSGNF